MRLRSIHLKNFRLHANSRVEFPEHGVTGLVGPNEGGKSTVLEGIAFALFGTAATRGTKAGIRWHRAPSRQVAEVEVDFEVGGKGYRIHRTETDAKLFEAGASEPIAASISAVDSYVPQLLGMSRTEFMATFWASQKDLDRLRSMGGVERRMFFLQVMGVGRIDEALSAARSRKNALARDAAALSQGLGDRDPLDADVREAEEAVEGADIQRGAAVGAFEEAVGARDQIAGQVQTLERQKERHDELERARVDAERRAERAGEEIARLERQKAEAEAARSELAAAADRLESLPGLREELARLQEARARAGERKALAERLEALEREIGALEEERGRLSPLAEDDVHSELVGVNERLGEVDEEITSLSDARESERRELAATAKTDRRQAATRRRKAQNLRALGTSTPCPTCTRPLGEHHSGVIDGLLRQADDLDAEASDLEAQAAELAVAPDREMELAAEREKLEREYSRLRDGVREAGAARKRMAEISHALGRRKPTVAALQDRIRAIPAGDVSPQRLERLGAEVGELEALDRSLARARVLAESLAGIEGELEERRTHAVAAKGRELEALEEIEALGFDSEAYAVQKVRLREAEETLATARADRARADAEHRAALDRLERARKALAAYDERAEALRAIEADLRVHEAAADRLNAFRVEVAAGIRPELEELASGFVQLLTDGRHEALLLDEDFDAVLLEAGQETEVVSGGTEDVVAIALRLAISQMIAERAGHPLSLLIIDEPFGSLDATRRGNVLALIDRLSSVFEQVILISHVEETRDAVDHAILVEYDEAEGRSRVVGAGEPAEAAA